VSRELGRDHTPHALLDQSESIVSVGLGRNQVQRFPARQTVRPLDTGCFSLETTGCRNPPAPRRSSPGSGLPPMTG